MLLNRLGRRMLTCFKFISSKLEPAGTRGRDVEAGVMMFGRSDDSVSAWSASWKVVVSNVQTAFANLDQLRVCVGFPRSRRWMLHLIDSKRMSDSGLWESLSIGWKSIYWMDSYLNSWWYVRRRTLRIFFLSSKLILGNILITNWRHV